MIRSFKCKQTQALWQGKRVKAFDGFREQAERKLGILDAATSLHDLKALPGNRLETLLGTRKGQHSIRINGQWRLWFQWQADDALNVENRRLPLTGEHQ